MFSSSSSSVVQPFKFNFSFSDEKNPNENSTEISLESAEEQNSTENTNKPCKHTIQEYSPSSSSSPPSFSPVSFSFVCPRSLMKIDFLGSSTSLGSIVSHSDLIPNVYEGGFKLWECAIDVIQFLSDAANPIGSAIAGRRLLELGCGHGLPGVFSLIHFAPAFVAFQDYNPEVITNCTIPNVLENCRSHSLSELSGRCSYFSGDWNSVCLADLLVSGGGKFDFILTSDTIYQLKSVLALIKIIESTLAFPDGVAIVAAKRFYFGVGGNTGEFRQRIVNRAKEKCKTAGEPFLEAETVAVLEDGKSNIREIIKLKWNSGNGSV